MNRLSVLSSLSRRLLPVLLACGLASVPAAGADDEPPQLISTTGGTSGTQWTTLAELQTAAAADNPQACLQLGLRYETGDEVKLDYGRARALYEKAAAGGVAVAIYRLGRFYQNGLGIKPDPERAQVLYQLAALAGVPLAQYNLGAMLVSGRGVKRDYVDGLAWLILATRNQAGGDGEQRVRTHLADRPQVIAAAEKRAEQLGREVAARRSAKPPWPPPEPDLEPSPPAIPTPVMDKPKFEPPRVDPPRFEPPPLPPPGTQPSPP